MQDFTLVYRFSLILVFSYFYHSAIYVTHVLCAAEFLKTEVFFINKTIKLGIFMTFTFRVLQFAPYLRHI